MQSAAVLARDVIEWDIPNWSRALHFWEGRVPKDGTGRTALELGARHGGLSLWLALRGYDVICTDLQDVERQARPLHDRYGIANRVQYEAVDVLDLPYVDRFDVVAFKSVLTAVASGADLERQRSAVAQIYKALRPGGVLLFAENLRGSVLHRALRRTFTRWHAACRYADVSEMLEFMEPFASVEYETAGFLGLCGRSPAFNEVLGRIDGAVFNHVVPAQSRYLIYGAAWK